MARTRRQQKRTRAPAPVLHPPPGPRTREAPASSGPRLPWGLLGALGILALLFAARTPTLGMPAADDYAFLTRLAFQHPLDLFGSMGADFYWRPLSRQLYFSLVGPWLLRAPWAAAALHVALLLALYAVLYRIVRRRFDPAPAAAVACFPLLSEPFRILLAWPSGAQHLLAMLFAALAVERALAGRQLLAALAALLAVLSHEVAVLAIPALPLIAWFRTRRPRPALEGLALAAGILGLWGAGYAVALRHGVVFPSGTHAPLKLAEFPMVLLQGIAAHLGLEEVPHDLGMVVLALHILLMLVALSFLALRSTRARLRGSGAPLLGAAAWYVLGTLPLLFVLPDWNAWRTSVPSLGLGLALGGLLAAIRPGFAAAFLVLRLVVLLAARPAPVLVSDVPPRSPSDMSFVRLVRLQRIVESARRAVLRPGEHLPRGAHIIYWEQPRLSEVGFHGPDAARFWTADSGTVWRGVGGARGLLGRVDAVLEFQRGRAWPAVRIEPRAFRLFADGVNRMLDRDLGGADSLLLAAARAQPGSLKFHGLVAENRCRVLWDMGRLAEADSVNESTLAVLGETSNYYAFVARKALLRGDRQAAARALRRCLTLKPDDEDGLALARRFGLLQEGPTPPPGQAMPGLTLPPGR